MKLPKQIKFLKSRAFKSYSIYVIIVGILIFILYMMASNIRNQEEISDYANESEVPITINRNGFSPSEIKINAVKKYDFIFSKGIFVTCSELTINELNVKTYLKNQKETVPIRISRTGTYEITCKEEGIKLR